MTDTQFFTVIGTIWMAPYVDKWFAQLAGVIFLSISIYIHWGRL